MWLLSLLLLLGACSAAHPPWFRIPKGTLFSNERWAVLLERELAAEAAEAARNSTNGTVPTPTNASDPGQAEKKEHKPLDSAPTDKVWWKDQPTGYLEYKAWRDLVKAFAKKASDNQLSKDSEKKPADLPKDPKLLFQSGPGANQDNEQRGDTAWNIDRSSNSLPRDGDPNWSQMRWAASLAREWLNLSAEEQAQLLNNWDKVSQWVAQENKWKDEEKKRSQQLNRNRSKTPDRAQIEAAWKYAAPLAQEWLKLTSDQKDHFLNNLPWIKQWVAEEYNMPQGWHKKGNSQDDQLPETDWNAEWLSNLKGFFETGHDGEKKDSLNEDGDSKTDVLQKDLDKEPDWSQVKPEWQPFVKELLKLGSEQKAQLFDNWLAFEKWIADFEKNHWSKHGHQEN